MRALIIEHDHCSPPGPVAERLAEHGYEITEFLVVPARRFAEPDIAVEFPDLSAYDVVVPMGAPWSVDDHATIGSWIEPELEALRRAHDAGTPILGICFGAQALATALGGGVERCPAPEIGWTSITTAGSAISTGPWFQFHYDRFSLPPGASLLAWNSVGPQAFAIGRSLGIQFHPEVTGSMLAGWLANGARSSLEQAGLDADALLAQTIAETAAARLRAHALDDSFLVLAAGGSL